MNNEKLNTAVLSQFINTVKGADMAGKRDVRLDIEMARNVAYTIGLAMTKLASDYESVLASSKPNEVVEVKMDGGTGW